MQKSDYQIVIRKFEDFKALQTDVEKVLYEFFGLCKEDLRYALAGLGKSFIVKYKNIFVSVVVGQHVDGYSLISVNVDPQHNWILRRILFYSDVKVKEVHELLLEKFKI